MADIFFLKSKVRDFAKGHGLNTGKDVVDGDILNSRIEEILLKGISRAKANGRKTLLPRDI